MSFLDFWGWLFGIEFDPQMFELERPGDNVIHVDFRLRKRIVKKGEDEDAEAAE